MSLRAPVPRAGRSPQGEGLFLLQAAIEPDSFVRQHVAQADLHLQSERLADLGGLEVGIDQKHIKTVLERQIESEIGGHEALAVTGIGRGHQNAVTLTARRRPGGSSPAGGSRRRLTPLISRPIAESSVFGVSNPCRERCRALN